MKEKITIMAWITHHFALLIAAPLFWLYCFFFNQQVFLRTKAILTTFDTALDYVWGIPAALLFSFFWLQPMFYLFIVLFYSLLDPKIYRFLSFSYIKTNLYIKRTAYFYPKLLTNLHRLFEDERYKGRSERLKFTYHEKNRRLSYSFYEKEVNQTLMFELSSKGFRVSTSDERKRYGPFVKLKTWDEKIYKAYFESLLAYVEELERDRYYVELSKKREQQNEDEQEQENLRERKENLLEEVMALIVKMKNNRVSKKELLIGDEKY